MLFSLELFNLLHELLLSYLDSSNISALYENVEKQRKKRENTGVFLFDSKTGGGVPALISLGGTNNECESYTQSGEENGAPLPP